MDLDELAEEVTRHLRLAGLQPHTSFDVGGFGVGTVDTYVSVVWLPTDALAEPAYAEMISGDGSRAAALHLGTVKNTMADAMTIILRSAGLNAVRSSNDMSPEVVEVRVGSPSMPGD